MEQCSIDSPPKVELAQFRRFAANLSEFEGFCVVLRLAKHVFLEAGAPQSDTYCWEDAPWAPVLLGPHCPLIARKFPENTASQVCLVWPPYVGIQQETWVPVLSNGQL